jgi:N-methylhydantoinase B/acetone carboxylase alpha subunit
MGLINGKKLKEYMEEIDKLTEESGYYAGLKDLRLWQEDPLKFNRFAAKLYHACATALQTAKIIAASPAAREMGEMLVCIATPEGKPVATSLGLVPHVGLQEFQIRWLIENNYENNPGIRDGDIFCNNDPRCGCAHPADCNTFVPIFYQDELIAWSASINHILDVGSPLAGGIPLYAPDTTFDGFLYPTVKAGENFEYFQWFDLMWKRRTRVPSFNILDERARGSGCILLRNRLLEIVEEFGIDYVKEGMKELVELARREAQDKIKTLFVPGRYRIISFKPIFYKGIWDKMFPQSAKNWFIHCMANVFLLPEGKIFMDYDGSSSWDWNHAVGAEHLLRAVQILSLAFYIPFATGLNGGLLMNIDLRTTKGSIYRGLEEHPLTSASLPWIAALLAMGYVGRAYIQSMFSAGYMEECVLAETMAGIPQGGGILPDGNSWAWSDFEHMGASGVSACAYRDGFVQAYQLITPITDFGTVEDWEYVMPPCFYLGRSLLPDEFGHGKFRASNMCQATWVVLDPGAYMTLGGMSNPPSLIPLPANGGMSGGYPFSGNYIAIAKNTNIRELIEKRLPLPRNFHEVLQYIKEGKLQAGEIIINKIPEIQSEVIQDGDIFTFGGGTGSGWGDPIERSPELIQQDLKAGYITPEVAYKIYGASVAEDKEGVILDMEKTAELRQNIRDERKKRGIPVKEWWKKEREQILKGGSFSEEIRNMYQDCLKYKTFKDEFLSFWQLPDDLSIFREE